MGALVEVVRALAEAGVGVTPDKLERTLAEPVLDLSVSLGSVLEGLKECLATVDGVARTAEGARAFEGLPQTGNGLAYMSPRMTRQMHAALDQVIAANGQSVLTLMARFLLPSVGYPVGWVVRNEDEGILFTSNTPSSHKSTLLTLGFVGALPAVVALGSSMSEPDETLPE